MGIMPLGPFLRRTEIEQGRALRTTLSDHVILSVCGAYFSLQGCRQLPPSFAQSRYKRASTRLASRMDGHYGTVSVPGLSYGTPGIYGL